MLRLGGDHSIKDVRKLLDKPQSIPRELLPRGGLTCRSWALTSRWAQRLRTNLEFIWVGQPSVSAATTQATSGIRHRPSGARDEHSNSRKKLVAG